MLIDELIKELKSKNISVDITRKDIFKTENNKQFCSKKRRIKK